MSMLSQSSVTPAARVQSEPLSPTAGGPARFGHVDLLRGAAAMAVTYFHLSGCTGLSASIAHTGRYGNLGVEVFFVVSGFVVPWSLFRARYRVTNAGAFLLKRLVRLYPPFLAAIVLSLAVGVTGMGAHYSWPTATTLLANAGYLCPFLGQTWISPVFWTLGIELQFYLLLGLLYPVLAHRSDLFAVGASLGISSLAFLAPNPAHLFHWFELFALGTLVFRRLAMGLALKILLPACALLVGQALLIDGARSALAASSAALFIAFVRLPGSRSSARWLRPLAGLGVVSYSLYLVHWEIGRAIIIALRHWPGIVGGEVGRLTLGLIASVCAAAVFYVAIERPSVHASHRLALSKAAPAAPAHSSS